MRAVLLLCVVAAATALVFDQKKADYALRAAPLFEQFQDQYGKTYENEAEKQYRFQVFVENLMWADELQAGDASAVYGVTKFMDLTREEFKGQYLNFRPSLNGNRDIFEAPVRTTAVGPCPSTTDCHWENYNAITPVKDQGQCGSCWAFSATESTETWNFMGGKPLWQLSPQQVVDCDNKDAGCNGGDTPTAFNYIQSNGLEQSSDYPYTSGVTQKAGPCSYNSSKVVAHINGYKWGIPPCDTPATFSCNNQDEAGLWGVIQTIGPQSICVDAQPWQVYQSGIMTTSECKHGYLDLDHCVQLTGYGTSGSQKYWSVRNSWGASWGESGYIRLVYGVNECGVADEANYPTV
jgi:hypothetical protein